MKPKKVPVNNTNFKWSVLTQNRTKIEKEKSCKLNDYLYKTTAKLILMFCNPKYLLSEDERQTKIALDDFDADKAWSLA
jgi:hypothetical protein